VSSKESPRGESLKNITEVDDNEFAGFIRQATRKLLLPTRPLTKWRNAGRHGPSCDASVTWTCPNNHSVYRKPDRLPPLYCNACPREI